jgi:hypothetical protein
MAPAEMVLTIRRGPRMSARESASSSTISARLPSAIVPTFLSSHIIRAGSNFFCENFRLTLLRQRMPGNIFTYKSPCDLWRST